MPPPLPPQSTTPPDWPEPTSYITQTTRPLNCLVFLLPIIVLHLAGQLVFPIELTTGRRVVNAAFAILRGILSLFGSTSLYLPGLAVVLTLLIWHLAKGYPWRVRGRTILGMAVESFLFAWPVIVLCNIIVSGSSSATLVPAANPSQAHTLTGQAVLLIGAGIYEELLFRLALISLIAALITWLSDLAGDYALIFAAIASALLFGIYHFYFMPGTISSPPQHISHTKLFAFYFLSGGYFTGLYVLRGFGITVGAHIVHNLIWLFLFNP